MNKGKHVVSKVFNFNKLIVMTILILIVDMFYIQAHKNEMEKEYSLLFELKSMETIYKDIDNSFNEKVNHQSFDVITNYLSQFSELLLLLDEYSIFESENESTDFPKLYSKVKENFEVSKSYVERYNSLNGLIINSTRALYDMHNDMKNLINNTELKVDKKELQQSLDMILTMIAMINYNGLTQADNIHKSLLNFKSKIPLDTSLMYSTNIMSKHISVLLDGYEVMLELKKENEKLNVGDTINTIHALLLKNLKKKDLANRINIYALNIFILLLLIVLFIINRKEEKLHGKVYRLNKDLEQHVEELESLSYTLEERVYNRTKELELMVDKVEKLSVTDELTGLYNRRYYTQIITTEIKRAKRGKVFFGYLILDVDHFKPYNDNYGHQNGDIVLKKISKSLSESLARPDDFVFRIGGEEFVIIFTSDNEEKAILFANKVIDNVKDLKIKHEFNEAYDVITLSAGLVVVDPSESIQDEDTLYQKSDKLLYQAKESGRNCVKS